MEGGMGRAYSKTRKGKRRAYNNGEDRRAGRGGEKNEAEEEKGGGWMGVAREENNAGWLTDWLAGNNTILCR